MTGLGVCPKCGQRADRVDAISRPGAELTGEIPAIMYKEMDRTRWRLAPCGHVMQAGLRDPDGMTWFESLADASEWMRERRADDDETAG